MSERDDFRDTIGNANCYVPIYGLGRCPYCDEIYNNVAYHQAHECLKRPTALAYDAATGKAETQQLLPIPSWMNSF